MWTLQRNVQARAAIALQVAYLDASRFCILRRPNGQFRVCLLRSQRYRHFAVCEQTHCTSRPRREPTHGTVRPGPRWVSRGPQRAAGARKLVAFITLWPGSGNEPFGSVASCKEGCLIVRITLIPRLRTRRIACIARHPPQCRPALPPMHATPLTWPAILESVCFRLIFSSSRKFVRLERQVFNTPEVRGKTVLRARNFIQRTQPQGAAQAT